MKPVARNLLVNFVFPFPHSLYRRNQLASLQATEAGVGYCSSSLTSDK